MVYNPYAKKQKPASCNNKRPRPPEQKLLAANVAGPTATNNPPVPCILSTCAAGTTTTVPGVSLGNVTNVHSSTAQQQAAPSASTGVSSFPSSNSSLLGEIYQPYMPEKTTLTPEHSSALTASTNLYNNNNKQQRQSIPVHTTKSQSLPQSLANTRNPYQKQQQQQQQQQQQTKTDASSSLQSISRNPYLKSKKSAVTTQPASSEPPQAASVSNNCIGENVVSVNLVTISVAATISTSSSTAMPAAGLSYDQPPASSPAENPYQNAPTPCQAQAQAQAQASPLTFGTGTSGAISALSMPSRTNSSTQASPINPYKNQKQVVANSPNPYRTSATATAQSNPTTQACSTSTSTSTSTTGRPPLAMVPNANAQQYQQHQQQGNPETAVPHNKTMAPMPSKLPSLLSAAAPAAATTYNNQSSTNTSTSTTTGRSSMASLRPTSWATSIKSITKPNPVAVTTNAVSTMPPQRTGLEMPGEALIPPELYFSPESNSPVSDEHRQSLVKHANLSANLLNGWKLFSHQKKAILMGLLMRRMILALDMGLGKTLIGCVWSKAFKLTFDCLKIFVVCPVSLKAEWKRTAEEATGLKVEDDSPKAKVDKNSLDMHICSWQKVPTLVERTVGYYVVVCDEAHLMQSMQAARTKQVLTLVKDCRYVYSNVMASSGWIIYIATLLDFKLLIQNSNCLHRCVGVLLLTGTPMKNGKCANLFPLLKAVGHPFGSHQKAFEKHFCNGMEKNFGHGRPVWDASGSSNLKQLQRLVTSHLLHMTKEQCLAELPPMKRETRQVPVSSRFQLQYIQAVKNLVRSCSAMNSTSFLFSSPTKYA
jgi:hypothetical protein